MMQSNWEAVKALALDTTSTVQQQPMSPSYDAQSAAQVSCLSALTCLSVLTYLPGHLFAWQEVCWAGGAGVPEGGIL